MNSQSDLNHSSVSVRVDGPIDFPQLLRRCRGNEGIAREIVARFHQSIGDDVVLLEGALSRGDAEQLVDVAHRVKGTAANVGAEGIRDAAAEIEKIARSGKLEQVPRLLVRFSRDSLRLGQVMDKMEIRFDQGDTKGDG